jgi:hypothetical protein
MDRSTMRRQRRCRRATTMLHLRIGLGLGRGSTYGDHSSGRYYHSRDGAKSFARHVFSLGNPPKGSCVFETDASAPSDSGKRCTWKPQAHHLAGSRALHAISLQTLNNGSPTNRGSGAHRNRLGVLEAFDLTLGPFPLFAFALANPGRKQFPDHR